MASFQVGGDGVFADKSSADLTANPFAALEDKADPEIPTATLQIYEFIGQYLSRPKDTHVLRASSATYCYKRRWYQRRGVEGTPLTPRKIVNFLLGDLSERVLLYFIAQANVGPGKLYSEIDLGEHIGSLQFQGKELKIYRQQDLVVQAEGLEITCHVEGFGKRNSDGKWELIECKSASNYGYKDFKEDGPKDYLKQGMTGLRSDKALRLGAEQIRYFFLRKETGHIWDQLHDFDAALWEDVVNEFKACLEDAEPPAPYIPVKEMQRGKWTGRTVATFPCTYCPYLEKCLGPHKVDWKSDQFGFQKPVYVFREGVSLV